MLCRK